VENPRTAANQATRAKHKRPTRLIWKALSISAPMFSARPAKGCPVSRFGAVFMIRQATNGDRIHDCDFFLCRIAATAQNGNRYANAEMKQLNALKCRGNESDGAQTTATMIASGVAIQIECQGYVGGGVRDCYGVGGLSADESAVLSFSRNSVSLEKISSR